MRWAVGEGSCFGLVGGFLFCLVAHHLLGELGDGERTVLLRATRRERREADHEEVEARERDHVDGELAQVAVQLAREAQAAGGGRHHGGDEVVEVTEGGGGELEGAVKMVEELIMQVLFLIAEHG